jgi:hypothetical protein
MVVEKHVSAQEKSLEAVLAFIENSAASGR